MGNSGNGRGPFRAAVIWRSLPLRLAILALPAWLTLSLVVLATPWRLKILVALIACVTLAAPAAGLLVFAALAPLGELIGIFIGLERFHVTEAMAITFLAAFVARPLGDRPGPRVPAAAGWLLAAAVVASVAAQAWQIRSDVPIGELARSLALGYFIIAEPIGFIAGARVLEALALAAAAAAIFRRYPRIAETLPIALVGSAAVAAASSVLLWRGIAPAPVLERHARIGYRVSAHVGDPNAAGTYFALIVCVAAGMAVRARGRARAAWLAGGAMAATGLWFSESRSALAAAGIVLALATVWRASARARPAWRLAFVAAAAVAGLAAGSVRARLLELDPTYRGAGFRQQFNATSLRMLAARPLSGVGVGQYFTASPMFLSPQLAFAYGSENAHNYFLQMGGELGVPGLALFLLWLGIPAVQSARALQRDPRDGRLLGAFAGVACMYGTCLTGHPLLVEAVAYPFWLLFGLTAGLAGSVLANTGAEPTPHERRAVPPAMRAAFAAMGALIVLGAAVSVWRGPVAPAASAAVDGCYGWETAEDGTRFRWTRQYASVFVPSNVTRVYLPVRIPLNAPAVTPMGVEVMTAAVDHGRSLIGGTWANLNIVLPDVAPPVRFKRIDLRIDRTWQPGVYVPGSADMRSVGIQVGEPRLFHEY